MLKIVAFCLVLLGAEAYITFEDVLLEEFNLFKIQYAKTYKDRDEEQYRMSIYTENKLNIAIHNQQFHQGLVTFKLGMNKFGDLLSQEIFAKMHGFKNTTDYKSRGTTYVSHNGVRPDKIDWRLKGYVTPVKSQGLCGSCWAFSATGSLEGQIFKKTGKLVSLSEQNLVDCSKDEGDSGCEGGYITSAFDYIKNNHGIDTEKSYPYEGHDGTCRFQKDNIGATCSSFVNLPRGNEDYLQESIAFQGPISVAIDANHFSFNFYESGIYYEPQCNPNVMSHAVLAVGYGADEKEYYIVKNSWDVDWGEDGYIRMSRNKNNNCGISTMACYPVI
ncbi:hypothetical protein CHUAL_001833 [Chamberlinius hualienensis]